MIGNISRLFDTRKAEYEVISENTEYEGRNRLAKVRITAAIQTLATGKANAESSLIIETAFKPVS